MYDDKLNENNQLRNTDSLVSRSKQISNTSVQNDKSKKSYNVLSALVKRTKLNLKKTIKAHKEVDKLEFISSTSTFGSQSGDDVIERCKKTYNCDENCDVGTKEIGLTDSERSIHSVPKVKKKFFSKFLVTHGMSEHDKGNSVSFIMGDNSTECTNRIKRLDSPDKFHSFDPISLTKFENSTLSTSLANELSALQALASQLLQSEQYLIKIFKQYISDENLQKELVDSVCRYSKLHMETERMTSLLSMELYAKQIETDKTQQNALQTALRSVIRQNRQLLTEHEVLFLSYEKLLNKYQVVTDNDSSGKVTGCETEIRDVIKHNVELLNKMEGLCKQIEHFEAELTNSRKQNKDLESQLTTVSSQLHDKQTLVDRTKTDYEIEMTTLNREMKNKQKLLSDVAESCENFKKEFLSLEEPLKDLPLGIDWLQLKTDEKGLNHSIDFGRSCLNKLVKEVLNLHNQIKLREKDIEALVHTNGKLQENLKKSATELDILTKKMDDSSKISSEYNYKRLETELKINSEKQERLKFDHEMEKGTLMRKIQHYENMQSENHRLIEQSKIHINTLTSENSTLRSQLENLQITLNKTHPLLLSSSQEDQTSNKLSQKKYDQLLLDKQQLFDQHTVLKREYQKLIDTHEINHTRFQRQQEETTRLLNENKALLTKYEAKHSVVLSLQNERKKNLEEKSLLKALFDHMKNEIKRLQKLESTVSDISKEANKLAFVAEYNKELGKKLKTEIEEKDKTIIKLRTSVEKLNDIQMKSTKEKLSLFTELSEITQLKDKLDHALSFEFQKNVELDESRNEIVQSTNNQLRQIEQRQNKERLAFKDLLKDAEAITKERNALLIEKENTAKELVELKKGNNELSQQVEQLLLIKEENEQKVKDSEHRHGEDSIIIVGLQEKLELELKTYQENLKHLDKLINELRKEKISMEDSLKYLQNNVQKLHNDLDISRSKEKDITDSFKRCLSEKNELKEASNKAENLIQSLYGDKENLRQELIQTNLFCKKILTDFERNVKTATEKEELLKHELDEKRELLIEVGNKNKQLVKELLNKEEEIEKLVKECSDLKNAKTEYEKLKINLQNARVECESLYKQIAKTDEQKQTEISNYELQMNNLIKKNESLEEEIRSLSNLKADIATLNEKLQQEKASYTALSEINKEVSSNLVESIKNVVKENHARRETETKFMEAKEHQERLLSEKSDLQQQTNMLLDSLNETKNRINTLLQEKDDCQKSNSELQTKYNEVLKRCISLEREVRLVEDNDANQEKLKILKEENVKLRTESQQNQNTIYSLRQDVAQYQQQLIGLEFRKSEVTLRLHELQRKYDAQLNIYKELQDMQSIILNTVSKLRENGLVDNEQGNGLISLLQRSSNSDIDSKHGSCL